MPVYEYLCRTCDTRFEARRSMTESAAPIDCPDGHADTTRLLSVFASVGRSVGAAGGSAPVAAPVGGGCGPGCACAH
jgi:putative FmdB family regulatory protein